MCSTASAQLDHRQPPSKPPSPSPFLYFRWVPQLVLGFTMVGVSMVATDLMQALHARSGCRMAMLSPKLTFHYAGRLSRQAPSKPARTQRPHLHWAIYRLELRSVCAQPAGYPGALPRLWAVLVLAPGRVVCVHLPVRYGDRALATRVQTALAQPQLACVHPTARNLNLDPSSSIPHFTFFSPIARP